LNSPLYFTVSSPIQELSKKKLTSLLLDYYNKDNTVAAVIAKYKLGIPVRELVTFFPYYETDTICPYDNIPMLKRLPSRSTGLHSDGDLRCVKCGHAIFKEYSNKFCDCKGCRQKRLDFYKRMNKMYFEIKDDIPIYKNLSLKSKIQLAALLQVFDSVNYENIGHFTYDNKNYSIHLIKELSDRHLIAPSAENFPEDFSTIDYEQGNFGFNIKDINWRLNVQIPGITDDNVLLIAKMLGGKGENDPYEVERLYRDLVIDAMEYYFKDKFYLGSDGAR